MTIRVTMIGLALCGAVACERPGGSDSSTPAPPEQTATSPVSAPGRTISEAARSAMKDVLAGETTNRRAWILSQPGNDEVGALTTSLVSVFKDAGWEVKPETVSGIVLKPGVMTLIADEQYPPYVDTVVRALDASGLDAKSASGYRGYYEAKKSENPGWPGVPMRADQDFVIVVGPKPG